jgi:hypothetical protein
MGYRSDVAIAIYGPEKAMVPLLAAERVNPDSAVNVDAQYTETRRYTRGGHPWVMLFANFEHVKWYESFPDVIAWTQLVARAAETPDICTEFVRVGENSTDIEETYTGDEVGYYLAVSCRITRDLPDHTEEPS